MIEGKARRAKCLKMYMKGLQAYGINFVYRTSLCCWSYQDDHKEYIDIMESICIDLDDLYSDCSGVFSVQDIIDAMNRIQRSITND